MIVECEKVSFELSNCKRDDFIVFYDQAITDYETATAKLFDKIVIAVKGYIVPGEPETAAQEFRQPSKEILAIIPDSAKIAVVKRAYEASARIVRRSGRNTTVELKTHERTIEFDLRFKGKRSKTREPWFVLDFFDSHLRAARGIDSETLASFDPFHKFLVARKALGN